MRFFSSAWYSAIAKSGIGPQELHLVAQACKLIVEACGLVFEKIIPRNIVMSAELVVVLKKFPSRISQFEVECTIPTHYAKTCFD